MLSRFHVTAKGKRRCRDGILLTPAACKPVARRLEVDSVVSTPRDEGICNSIDRDHAPVRGLLVRTPVGTLLGCAGPADVTGFIIPVTIDTVERVRIAGASTDISEKILVAVPARAHRDSSRAVAGKVTVVGVLTAREHRSPRTVLGRFLPIRSFPVALASGSSSASTLDAQTSAGVARTKPQDTARHYFFDSAVAATVPARSPGMLRARKYGPAAKLLRSQINHFGHVDQYNHVKGKGQ